ncbi:MAG: Helix-turn-helix domain [Solirubrobacteraceae bacterium]|jgi:DNA-binding XRE family transcriptional regulator|nr:Helix-turn-helix domain [Solirubrobacteraceae bacterium]
MSQDDLARTSGIQRKTVYQIEIGKTDPRLGTVRRIARALEIEAWELLRASTRPPFGGGR